MKGRVTRGRKLRLHVQPETFAHHGISRMNMRLCRPFQSRSVHLPTDQTVKNKEGYYLR